MVRALEVSELSLELSNSFLYRNIDAIASLLELQKPCAHRLYVLARGTPPESLLQLIAALAELSGADPRGLVSCIATLPEGGSSVLQDLSLRRLELGAPPSDSRGVLLQRHPTRALHLLESPLQARELILKQAPIGTRELIVATLKPRGSRLYVHLVGQRFSGIFLRKPRQLPSQLRHGVVLPSRSRHRGFPSRAGLLAAQLQVAEAGEELLLASAPAFSRICHLCHQVCGQVPGLGGYVECPAGGAAMLTGTLQQRPREVLLLA